MLTIAGTQFASRLFVGTGKFASSKEMKEAISLFDRHISIKHKDETFDLVRDR